MTTSTPSDRSLHGSCTCGRNTYIIEIPPQTPLSAVRENVKVVSGPIYTLHPSPLPAAHPPTLRVPLPWYHTTTYALFPDETHSTIHRIFHSSFPSPSSPTNTTNTTQTPTKTHSQRHFCGYCGVRVSEWCDGHEMREWIFVDLGSLEGKSLVVLEGWGADSSSSSDNDDDDYETEAAESREKNAKEGTTDTKSKHATKAEDEAVDEVDTPSTTGLIVERREGRNSWFERVVADMRGGGRVQIRRGGESSAGAARVEWEVAEWVEGDGDGDGDVVKVVSTTATGKRKIRDGDGDGDVVEGEGEAMEE